jgi:hypothetical protein
MKEEGELNEDMFPCLFSCGEEMRSFSFLYVDHLLF